MPSTTVVLSPVMLCLDSLPLLFIFFRYWFADKGSTKAARGGFGGSVVSGAVWVRRLLDLCVRLRQELVAIAYLRCWRSNRCSRRLWR
ncbi:hypothetical protein RYX36_006646 [Vicia faba]